jgi:hypothetical protein
MAWIFSGFASIPLAETKNPRSAPAGTPKEHFVGLSLRQLIEIVESFLQILD